MTLAAALYLPIIVLVKPPGGRGHLGLTVHVCLVWGGHVLVCGAVVKASEGVCLMTKPAGSMWTSLLPCSSHAHLIQLYGMLWTVCPLCVRMACLDVQQVAENVWKGELDGGAYWGL